ncbi:MAG: SDR family NAD(P)-dependent oxidoreductase, partial [Vicinamibacterales bacterium]
MNGQTVLVTGATSGIGLESAAVLAGMGANVILVGRDE